MENLNSPEVKIALDWFLGFIEPSEWSVRKDNIEQYLESVFVPKHSRHKAITPNPVSINDDRMGWYLYLAETVLTDVTKYEPIQGARIIPIFERIGMDFELLLKIDGIEKKVKRLLSVEKSNPDSGLFEILVALLWKRNGWKEVEFIPEAPPDKRPDIRVASEDTEWFIECKRLAKTSAYSQAEREKWLIMWRHIRNYLIDNSIPAVLDIVFHVELETLPDTFIVDQLYSKLPLVSSPCTLVSNDQWEVTFNLVNFEKAREHLKRNYVKYPSDQLNELIAGYRDPNRGFTCAVAGNIVRFGEGKGNNNFLDTMDFAACAFWHCDAERAIEKKARDIRGHLAKAVEQLPEKGKCVIHVGLETLDGVLVEAERYGRIFATVQKFDPKNRDLRWVYCHLFQSYAPPEQAWVIDETVYYFSHTRYRGEKPLRHTGTIVPDGNILENEVHWLRDAP